jgi:hypothetical protein
MHEITDEEAALSEAMRNRGGRPPDRARNQWLLEIVKDAERRGITRRDCLREAFQRKHGRAADPDDVHRYERQIDRLLRPKDTRRPFAGAGESTGAVSGKDAPNTAPRK